MKTKLILVSIFAFIVTTNSSAQLLDLIKSKYSGIDSSFDFGEVLQTGYVDSALLLNSVMTYLSANWSYKAIGSPRPPLPVIASI